MNTLRRILAIPLFLITAIIYLLAMVIAPQSTREKMIGRLKEVLDNYKPNK